MGLKLTILSRYSRLGASSRLRTLAYLPFLNAAGFEVTCTSFFDDDHLKQIYSNQLKKTSIPRYYSNRALHCLDARKSDVIWIEKEAFPWMPWALERLALPRSIPIISDYDDALFHQYDLHSNSFVRAVLGRKIDRVMQNSDLVTAGNSYLANRAKAAGAKQVEIVPTVVDATAYWPQTPTHANGKLRIGWIGTPQTWGKYGTPNITFFRDFAKKHNVIFRIIGASLSATHDNEFEYLPWTEPNEVSLIQGMHIGIMPLTDSPWERGKCGYKLIQYMACGLPVVASPVGVNGEIVEHGINGLLAKNIDEWQSTLARLVSDPQLRAAMGAAGRKKVLDHYSLQAQGPRLVKLIAEVAASRC